jgi:hypothetical protein
MSLSNLCYCHYNEELADMADQVTMVDGKIVDD